jgi:hypothetical protein
VNRGSEPPVRRWIKRQTIGDDGRTVAHLLNLLSANVVVYAAVTRGGLAVARVLERVVRS